jgi:putative acetyltransferase
MEQTENRQIEEVEILPFSVELREYFNTLNREWIEQFFVVEEIDRKVLEEPEEYILSKGGKIFFARYNGEIVGTCALKKVNDERYEMTKMAVSPKAQGKQIGKKLALAMIEEARALNAKILYLESSTKLTTALKLYERVGFQHTPRPGGPSVYDRADVYMEIELK